MRTKDLLELWKNDLIKVNSNIQVKIDLVLEDTVDEEFFIYINIGGKYIPYGFFDDCGYGIGLRNNNEKISYAYYFNDLGLNGNEKELIKIILIDIIKGEKIYIKLNDYSIDFIKYLGKENLLGFSNYERFSIYDINEKNEYSE